MGSSLACPEMFYVLTGVCPFRLSQRTKETFPQMSTLLQKKKKERGNKQTNKKSLMETMGLLGLWGLWWRCSGGIPRILGVKPVLCASDLMEI